MCSPGCIRKICLTFVHQPVYVCVCACVQSSKRGYTVKTSVQSAEHFVLQKRRSFPAWGFYLCIFVCVCLHAMCATVCVCGGETFSHIRALIFEPPTFISHRLCSAHIRVPTHNKMHCCFWFSHMQQKAHYRNK